MELFEVIRQRYSVRAFKNAPIGEQAEKIILEAANNAPSAGNLQAYEIVVVRDAARKRELAKVSCEQYFLVDAPVVLVFCANPDRNREKYGVRGAERYCIQDASIACAYVQLAAAALGLGSCWIGAFEEPDVQRIIKTPAAWRPIAILPVGIPADVAKPRARRPLTNLVHPEPQ